MVTLTRRAISLWDPSVPNFVHRVDVGSDVSEPNLRGQDSRPICSGRFQILVDFGDDVRDLSFYIGILGIGRLPPANTMPPNCTARLMRMLVSYRVISCCIISPSIVVTVDACQLT
jgi:hypothetical protein